MTRRTLKAAIPFEGTGLHTGAAVRLILKPAAAGSGVTFIRGDLPGAPRLRALASLVGATERGTVVQQGGATAATIEHLLSALYGMGVDDVECELFGPEVPIMDGSARLFVEGLVRGGFSEQEGERPVLRVAREAEVSEAGKRILARPFDGLRLHFMVDYGHPHLGRQELALDLTPLNYASQLAPARTFCFQHEIEAMRANGLARGGDLGNALVIGPEGLLNPPLRFADEFVRHKMLDFMGDLSLAGAPVQGEFFIEKSGHTFNVKMVRAWTASGLIA
jgi:UDP-3-O-[3-hydroxymyristoyl] N-acetylglucosamine deacetylase